MFVVRNVVPADVEQLLELAETVHSSNLPPDPQAMADRIDHSLACFQGRDVEDAAVYMFVLEDTAGEYRGRQAGVHRFQLGAGLPHDPT